MKNYIVKSITAICVATFALTMSSIAFASDENSQTFSYTNFSKIEPSGAWKVKINYADKYSIKVFADKNIMDKLIVAKTGDTLKLGEKFNVRFNDGAFTAEITMPKLEKIDASGATKITFKGFTLDDLAIQLSGASKVYGVKNQIKNLELKSSGTAEIDLSDTSVVNTKLDLSGATKVKININGGDLTGTASGVTKVIYTGNPKVVEVNTSGMAKITNK